MSANWWTLLALEKAVSKAYAMFRRYEEMLDLMKPEHTEELYNQYLHQVEHVQGIANVLGVCVITPEGPFHVCASKRCGLRIKQ